MAHSGSRLQEKNAGAFGRLSTKSPANSAYASHQARSVISKFMGRFSNCCTSMTLRQHKTTLTDGAVAVWTNPLRPNTRHLPDGFIVWCVLTGNSDDVTVTCHLHAALHRGIDTADHCRTDITAYNSIPAHIQFINLPFSKTQGRNSIYENRKAMAVAGLIVQSHPHQIHAWKWNYM